MTAKEHIWQQPANVTIDAALARPIHKKWLDDKIIGIGSVQGSIEADVGQTVQKSGRSTGLTRGQITVVGTTVTVAYGMGRSARFTNQIVTTKMGAPGDSGSLLLDLANRAVGLLFAGGSQATLFHPIGDVLGQLKIRLKQNWQEDSAPFPSLARGYRSLQEICKEKSCELLQLPNVVGVGIGHKQSHGFNLGELCLTVLVTAKVPKAALTPGELVPLKIGGIITDVIETGILTADAGESWYGERQERRAKERPARPGLSIAHYNVSAGTLGAVVYDASSKEPLILSNNHVLANATNGEDGLSALGDAILQPGRSDGGHEEKDIIARLLRFHPLQFT
ncbi:MAG: S1 family peptidase [Firmicutes bacterium]|nr:S1 family peptidase [Bacillota bacterium]